MTTPLIIAGLAGAFPESAANPTLAGNQQKMSTAIGTAVDIQIAIVAAEIAAVAAAVSALGGEVASLSSEVGALSAKVAGLSVPPTATPKPTATPTPTPTPPPGPSADLETITIAQDGSTILVGQAIQLSATATNQAGATVTPALTWGVLSSADGFIISVDGSGVATGISPGTATVTVDGNLNGAKLGTVASITVAPNPNIPSPPPQTPEPTPTPTTGTGPLTTPILAT